MLGRVVVTHTFNPSTWEAEAGVSHPAKFPVYEKELKKILEPAVMVHPFNPSMWKGEAGGSLVGDQTSLQSKFKDNQS